MVVFCGKLPLMKVNPLQARRFAKGLRDVGQIERAGCPRFGPNGGGAGVATGSTRFQNNTYSQGFTGRTDRFDQGSYPPAQSGQWKGKSFISGGRKSLRDALYMPALVAMRYNPDLKVKYQALRDAGKPAKPPL